MLSALKRSAKNALSRMSDKSSPATSTSGTRTTESPDLSEDAPTAGKKTKPIPYKQCKDPIEHPQDFDILLGRGKTSFNNRGNRRFRVFVAMHLRRYMDAATRTEKTIVVNFVTQAIHDAGGRFLKNRDNNTQIWYQVSQKVAREKVGHALRDAVTTRLKMSQTGTLDKQPMAKRRASDISITALQAASGLHRPLLPCSDMDRRNTKSCSDLIQTAPAGIAELALLFSTQGVEPLVGPTPICSAENNQDKTLGPASATETKNQRTFDTAVANIEKLIVDSYSKKVMPTGENSGEFSMMSEMSRKWNAFDNMESGDFTVDSAIFDDCHQQERKEDAVTMAMHNSWTSSTAAAAAGATASAQQLDKPGPTVNAKRGKKLSVKEPWVLEFKSSPNPSVVKRKGSCEELSEDFSIMSIDTRLSRMGIPDISGEFSLVNGWNDITEVEPPKMKNRTAIVTYSDDDHGSLNGSKQTIPSSINVKGQNVAASHGEVGFYLRKELPLGSSLVHFMESDQIS